MDETTYHQFHASYPVPKAFSDEIFSSDEITNEITNLNKINLFVGANNSGKSRLIRELLKIDPPIKPNLEIIKFIESERAKTLEQIKALFEEHGFEYQNFRVTYFDYSSLQKSFSYELFDTFFNLSLRDTLPGSNFILDLIGKVQPHITGIAEHYTISINHNVTTKHIVVSLFNKVFAILITLKNQIDDFFTLKFSPVKTYIPSVRFLREFPNKNQVTSQTIGDYGFAEKKYNIQDGIAFYKQMLGYQTGVFKEREIKKNLQAFLSEFFFNGKPIEITAISKSEDQSKNIVHITIGDEREQPIQNLGDGIQMIIIMALPFFSNDCGIVAIEEPELYIHPGLQKQFLDFLLHHPKTKNFQVFIATHSNHFLDASLHTQYLSIFNVSKRLDDSNDSQKLPKFNLENVSSGNENSLTLLGVNNSSVYLSNCTIWVEGVTDKLYLQRFISELLDQEKADSPLLQFKKFFEGINYSFVYSGGDTIVHWDFSDEAEYEDLSHNILVKKLCGKAMVIVDNDFGKNKERKKGLEKVLGQRLTILPVPEIENLLSQDTIIETLKEFPNVSKNQNKISRVDDSFIKTTKLGTLIDDHILRELKSSFSEPKNNSENSKSIRSQYKLKFCQRSLSHISYSNMTNEAKAVAKEIIEFVITQNKYRSS